MCVYESQCACKGVRFSLYSSTRLQQYTHTHTHTQTHTLTQVNGLAARVNDVPFLASHLFCVCHDGEDDVSEQASTLWNSFECALDPVRHAEEVCVCVVCVCVYIRVCPCFFFFVCH
jgi:hypothetical protein